MENESLFKMTDDELALVLAALRLAANLGGVHAADGLALRDKLFAQVETADEAVRA